MNSEPFFTRSPRLAFVKKIILNNANVDSVKDNLKFTFKAIDIFCAEHFPPEDRGGWFSPLLMGGVSLNHTPPQIICAALAIYADLAKGMPSPSEFLASPLNWNGATAVQLKPSDRFLLRDRDRELAQMTDILFIIPTIAPEQWTSDYYGLPTLKDSIITIGWHAAAESRFAAMCGGFLCLDPYSKKVINPMAPFTLDEERLFFAEASLPSTHERHRERLSGFLGTPADVIEGNHETARKVIEAYLAAFP